MAKGPGRKMEKFKRGSDLPENYPALLKELKARIRQAQIKAALSVNRELIKLYWETGRSIVLRQSVAGWGSAVIERLASDLQKVFPDLKGFSPRNIWRMRSFYLAYSRDSAILTQPASELHRGSSPGFAGGKTTELKLVRQEVDGQNLPQFAAEIPWFHNVILIEKLKDPIQRWWYGRQTIEQGWSRAVLVHQIESGLYQRQGKAITNFRRTLPPLQSDLAEQVLKDPYNFDFLTIDARAREKELERNLMNHLQRFLVELGVGFAFAGKQVPMEIGGEVFYLDLLFYHLRLRCFVVIELKARPFKPEFAGKMNFYLSAVDDLLRHPDDQPSIGIIICQSKNKIIAEYALRDLSKPIGVSEYKLTRSLPREFKSSLPRIEDLEKELSRREKI